MKIKVQEVPYILYYFHAFKLLTLVLQNMIKRDWNILCIQAPSLLKPYVDLL